MRDGIFLGRTSTKKRIKCLAPGHNAVPLVKIEPNTLDRESSTLPLSRKAYEGLFGSLYEG